MTTPDSRCCTVLLYNVRMPTGTNRIANIWAQGKCICRLQFSPLYESKQMHIGMRMYIYIVQGLLGRGFVANNGRTCSVCARLSNVCLCVCGCRLLNRRWSTPLKTAPRQWHRVSPGPGRLLLLAARCVLSECGACLQC